MPNSNILSSSKSVINRMGANSFRLKGWAVVLVSVLMILV